MLQAWVCGIADSWIDVHAMMAITMLLISSQNRTCWFPVFQKGQQLWSNHDVKLCGHESKILAQEMDWFHPAHGEKKNGLVASRPWRKEKTALSSHLFNSRAHTFAGARACTWPSQSGGSHNSDVDRLANRAQVVPAASEHLPVAAISLIRTVSADILYHVQVDPALPEL
jgi:hypothetical protein